MPEFKPDSNPELFLKPGAMVRITDEYIEKRMGPAEVAAYEVLDYYREQLHGNAVLVVLPKLLEYDETSQIGVLTNIGNFRHYSCTEYFGQCDIYVPSYYAAIHGMAKVLRAVIPESTVPNKTDYEILQPGQVSSIEYLKSGLTGNESNEVAELLEIADYVNNTTQDTILKLPLQTGHLDPNPNNFHVITRNNHQTVAAVDWETFGVARTGYDEGRIMSYLALDANKQDEYSAFVGRHLNRDELTYFWRVAINRSVREYISFDNGHYDSRLNAGTKELGPICDTKKNIKKGLKDIIARAALELDRLS